MTEWISVEDELPLRCEWYLCFYLFDGKGYTDVIFFDGINEHGIHWLKDGDFEEKITHWQLLPEPPND